MSRIEERLKNLCDYYEDLHSNNLLKIICEYTPTENYVSFLYDCPLSDDVILEGYGVPNDPVVGYWKYLRKAMKRDIDNYIKNAARELGYK